MSAMTDRTGGARKFAEESTVQAKRTFEKASAAGEEAYSRVAQGTIDFHRKVLEIAQANVDAAFDCAQELVGVTSPSQFIEVATKHARQQVQSMTEQNRELAELAQKAATDSIKPLAGGLTSAFHGTT
jgi:phasin family protein